ncbi:ABC transporter ATP-binding protein [Candidatus Sumerlaeota bacterium]|nr:ABC transporter ATP-binding protein [Candidatus Sumerlaeota bacterium]
MTEHAIEVVNLSKRYRIYRQPIDRLLEWILPFKTPLSQEFWALRNISLSISKGDAVGIIGANGAGKSTLLKIISGTSSPTRGKVQVNGRIAGLLELGMGFHPELTGRQNIKMNGKLLGLSEQELEEHLPSITAFSELGDFIDQPLRTYSSGMYVRLGFSVAASVNPDILIIDEALSVGDAHFQQKCVRRIREIHEKGVTLLFVSHDPGAVRNLCRHAILMEEGAIISSGDSEEMLDHYNALIAKRSSRETGFRMERVISGSPHLATRHSGNFMAVITDAGLLNEQGEKITSACSGDNIKVYVKTFFLGDVDNPTIGFLIKDRLGNEIFGTNSYMLGRELGRYKSGETLELNFSFPLNIGSGEYTLTAAAHAWEFHTDGCYDWADKISIFTVIPSTDFKFIGSTKCYPVISHKKIPSSENAAQMLLDQLFNDAPHDLHMGPACQKFLCYGWYNSEQAEPDHTLRWTDGEFAFVIQPKGNRLVLNCACAKPDIASQPVQACVTANGAPVGAFSIDQSSLKEIIMILPEELVGKIVLFIVKLSSTWKPSRYHQGSDERRLGVIIRDIRTED